MYQNVPNGYCVTTDLRILYTCLPFQPSVFKYLKDLSLKSEQDIHSE